MVNKNNLLQAKNISEIKRIRFFCDGKCNIHDGKIKFTKADITLLGDRK